LYTLWLSSRTEINLKLAVRSRGQRKTECTCHRMRGIGKFMNSNKTK
jgi:hypothetical protein